MNIKTSKKQTPNMHSDSGKGTWRRASQVDAKTFADNWERTFGKKDKKAKQSRKGAR